MGRKPNKSGKKEGDAAKSSTKPKSKSKAAGGSDRTPHPTSTPANSIRIHLPGHPGRKRLGEASEAAFLARAAALGFPVARPWGESDPYDALVGFIQKFWRVQVKCTQRYREGRYRVNNCGGNGEPYTSDEIDFVAAHVIPLDLWYIIPVEASGSRKGLRFYPLGSSHGLLEKYREAWCLLACPPKARGWKDVPVVCRCRELPTRCAVCPRKKERLAASS